MPFCIFVLFCFIVGVGVGVGVGGGVGVGAVVLVFVFLFTLKGGGFRCSFITSPSAHLHRQQQLNNKSKNGVTQVPITLLMNNTCIIYVVCKQKRF